MVFFFLKSLLNVYINILFELDMIVWLLFNSENEKIIRLLLWVKVVLLLLSLIWLKNIKVVF